MGGVRNARMIKAQVCCSMGCKWCMAYAYILVCYVIPRASPSELHKHPRMYTYAIHHDNPCYNIYLYCVQSSIYEYGPVELTAPCSS